jgi:protein-tyrosine phosphatase
VSTAPFWVATVGKGRLAVMPRPRGEEWLEDDVRTLAAEGVHLVVSLLTSDEQRELGLDREPELCARHRIGYVSFPIRDRDVPDSKADVVHLARGVAADLRAGRNVVIHCRAGIGRSALIAGAVLIVEGWTDEEAFWAIGAARGFEVPETIEQRARAREFAAHCRLR